MASPTARTLQHLRKEGWQPQVVEKTIPKSFIKQDLFGCIDIVAVREGETIGVQATSSPHVMERAAKSCNEPRLVMWLLAGNRFEVWGWAKRGPRGKAKHWTLKKLVIALYKGKPCICMEDEE